VWPLFDDAVVEDLPVLDAQALQRGRKVQRTDQSFDFVGCRDIDDEGNRLGTTGGRPGEIGEKISKNGVEPTAHCAARRVEAIGLSPGAEDRFLYDVLGRAPAAEAPSREGAQFGPVDAQGVAYAVFRCELGHSLVFRESDHAATFRRVTDGPLPIG